MNDWSAIHARTSYRLTLPLDAAKLDDVADARRRRLQDWVDEQRRAFVDRLVDGVSSFLLGGRSWAVMRVQHDDRRVMVESAPRAGSRQSIRTITIDDEAHLAALDAVPLDLPPLVRDESRP